MLNETYIVVDNGPRGVHRASQVGDVLPNDGSDFVKNLKLVAVVLLKHTARAHKLLTVAAEVLHCLLSVLLAVDLACLVDTSLRRSDRTGLLHRPVRSDHAWLLKPTESGSCTGELTHDSVILHIVPTSRDLISTTMRSLHSGCGLRTIFCSHCVWTTGNK